MVVGGGSRAGIMRPKCAGSGRHRLPACVPESGGHRQQLTAPGPATRAAGRSALH